MSGRRFMQSPMIQSMSDIKAPLGICDCTLRISRRPHQVRRSIPIRRSRTSGIQPVYIYLLCSYLHLLSVFSQQSLLFCQTSSTRKPISSATVFRTCQISPRRYRRPFRIRSDHFVGSFMNSPSLYSDPSRSTLIDSRFARSCSFFVQRRVISCSALNFSLLQLVSSDWIRTSSWFSFIAIWFSSICDLLYHL